MNIKNEIFSLSIHFPLLFILLMIMILPKIKILEKQNYKYIL